ncbi:hypothetical protein LIER_06927 [Lithospermum erythrorhizon]|uniref:Uncharacterized protein n=1 Tax=Lithospermum erythrorhizon TaxID=34254 RepID=A0AAV3P6E0_LITER
MQPHWNSEVHKMTVIVRKKFLEKDGELFEECQRQYAEKQDKALEVGERRESTWQKLAVLLLNKLLEHI